MSGDTTTTRLIPAPPNFVKGVQGFQARPVEERLWSRVDKDGPIIYTELGACWIWTGGKSRDSHQYGRIDYQGKIRHTHQVSWILTNGPIPQGMHVLHKCDNPPCVNPSHLYLGDDADNHRDAIARGRIGAVLHPESYRGTGNSKARLDDDKVREIRSRYATGSASSIFLGKLFGVSSTTILKIIKRELWKHVQ